MIEKIKNLVSYLKKPYFQKKLLSKVGKICIYIFLILVGFIFLYPLLNMLSYSFKDSKDLVNPMVSWIPSSLYLGNYEQAIKVLDYIPTLLKTIGISVIPSLIQTISCSFIGYGFSRFDFPLKKLWFFLVIATFIIPSQITAIPQFLMFKNLGLLENILSYILPALFGQGIKSAIFILIFYSFFNQIPKVLQEAAEVDGANPFVVFVKVAVPMVLPAYLITFLFSLVWYWNETYLASMLLGGELQTLPMKLQQFASAFASLYPENSAAGLSLNEAVEMAGTFLNIAPLLIVYFFTQKWFVESIDKAGITGE